MPNEFGGDQCGKDYAPHMWIGEHCIGGTEKTVTVDGWVYRVGRTDDETLVAERYKDDSNIERWDRVYEIVESDNIPDEVRNAISPTASADREEEVVQLQQVFNPES